MVSTTPPAATPTDFGGIASRLEPAGITVDDVVSGDAGCDATVLIQAAIGFDASGLDQPTPVRIHLYIFRDHDAFLRRRDEVPACARSFVTDPDTFEQIEASPYVAAAQGPWGQQFGSALRNAFASAAGNGG